MIMEFELSTAGQTAFIDITQRINKIIKESEVKSGICVVFVPHTTAAVTINENADPSVRKDIVDALDRTVPEKNVSYAHLEGNSPAHIKASLLGTSETILVKDGSLMLGTWQGVYFCEFDGPRRRKVIVKIIRG